MSIIRHIIDAYRDWYKPEWLYQSMPLLYISSGVLAIARLRNGIGLFSGGILIMTSAVVLSQRYSYRRQKVLEEVEKEEENREFKVVGTLVWRSSFNCGNKLIDRQHQSLFYAANKITEAIIDDKQEIDYDTTVLKLLGEIQRHFRDEEKFLNAMVPEIASLHKDIHKKLLSRIMSLVNRIREEEATSRELLRFLIVDVIANHILKEDLKWQEMLKNG
ncbi:MAG: hemerythrin family protein [Candidatus Electrothrix sp. Rat3]|nr:hemerythrin family protein [Candidatus Electrothrix rattekaaiensis]